MAGLMVSFILLLQGLEMTSTMDMNTQLPVLPVDLIRSSSLGGGMVQFFLGSAVVMPDQGAAALVGLHPLAVAGFMGCITNALALLPLGREYASYFLLVLHTIHLGKTHSLHSF